MTEDEPTPETQGYSREQVVAEFRPFVEAGVTHPDDLDPSDPAVSAAQEKFFAWNAEEHAKAERNPDPAALLEYNLSASTLYLDAGFSDPDYIDEVANDWLVQDLDRAESENLPAVAAKIQAKIDELNGTSGSSRPSAPTEVVRESGAPKVEEKPEQKEQEQGPIEVKSLALQASTFFKLLQTEIPSDDPRREAADRAMASIGQGLEAVGARYDGRGWSGPAKTMSAETTFELLEDEVGAARGLLETVLSDPEKKTTLKKLLWTIDEQLGR